MSINIGFFKATDTGYTGRIETLALKLQAHFHRILNRTNESAPGYEIFCGDLKIGAAWERQGTKNKYLSISFEDPSFSSGYYNLYRSNGVEESYTLTFERPKTKKAA